MVTNELLAAASENYGFDISTLRKISESTNQIYMFTKDNRVYILRLSNRPPEALVQITAELDWLYYLATHGVSVSLPLETRSGELAFGINIEEKYWIVCAFEFAAGRFWDKNDPEWWNERIFAAWGGAMGRLHSVTKNYTPSSNYRRGEFNGREALADSVRLCPKVDKILNALVPELLSLPRNRDSYGLIHYDLHPWNYYIEADSRSAAAGGYNYRINLFDFDDCLYGYFALDIGIALYHGLWWGRRSDGGTDFAEPMVRSFLQGYLAENPLDSFWLSKIPDFMRFRQICKFSWFYRPDDEDDHQRERIHNIERGVLFGDLELDPKLFTNV